MALVGDSIYKLALQSFARQRSQARTLGEQSKTQNRLNYEQNTLPYTPTAQFEAKQDIYGDAAGRGMLASSKTGSNITEFLKGWNDKLSGLKRDRNQANWGVDQSLSVTNQAIDDQKRQARDELIRRRRAAGLS